MQPTKVGRSGGGSLQFRPAQGVGKAFGVEPSAARLTSALQDFAQKCTDAAKIAGFAHAKKLCLEPTSFTVKAEGVNKNTPAEFQKTKLMTRLTYTLDEIEGPLEVSGDGTLKFEEKDGIDYAAVTVQLPGGERVPFLGSGATVINPDLDRRFLDLTKPPKEANVGDSKAADVSSTGGGRGRRSSKPRSRQFRRSSSNNRRRRRSKRRRSGATTDLRRPQAAAAG